MQWSAGSSLTTACREGGCARPSTHLSSIPSYFSFVHYPNAPPTYTPSIHMPTLHTPPDPRVLHPNLLSLPSKDTTYHLQQSFPLPPLHAPARHPQLLSLPLQKAPPTNSSKACQKTSYHLQQNPSHPSPTCPPHPAPPCSALLPVRTSLRWYTLPQPPLACRTACVPHAAPAACAAPVTGERNGRGGV